MPAGSKPCDAVCKFCKKTFNKDPNPVIKNPGPSDVLQRRAPGSKECKACFSYLRTGGTHGNMTRQALDAYLLDPENQSTYDEDFSAWCQSRREGKRRRGDESETAVVENSSSFSTKEVLGYLWTPALLKKHDKSVPKKLQTVQHQGKSIKGAIMEEWVLGAIEVSTNSSRAAKHITECGNGGEDDDDDARRGFEVAQKKVRVSATQGADSEIMLKGPKGGGEEEEWYAMMWGDHKFSSSKAASDDENSETIPKKRKVARNRQTTKANPFENSAGDSGPVEVEASSSTGSNAGGGWAMSLPRSSAGGKSKKAVQEQKELDKCEALSLQAKQLKTQMEDGRSVMQVTIKRVNDLFEKIMGRLSDESTKFFLEIIRQEGAGCRAEDVWQQLKDAKTLVEGISEFVESLQDAEASPETIRNRASVIKSLGVKLPRNINSVICRRAAEELMQKGEMQSVFEFLDMNFKDKHPDGISSMVPDSDLSDAATLDKVTQDCKDFQTFCLTNMINNILLQEVAEVAPPPNDDKQKHVAETNAKMATCVGNLRELLHAFEASNLYHSVAPERSQLRDDITRLLVLCNGALSDQVPTPTSTDALESAKNALTKNKATFHAGLTMYPVGVYMCSRASTMISTCRQDQVLDLEIEAAGEYAKTFTIASYVDISKTKDGELELAIPSPSKFFDMIAKFKHFSEAASEALKNSKQDASNEVRERIKELTEALFQFVEKRYETKFPDVKMLFKSLGGCNEKQLHDDALASQGPRTLSALVAFQPVSKTMLGKILGKGAAEFEVVISSAAKIAGLVLQAFMKLLSLNAESEKEGALMDESVVSLFASLQDLELMKNVGKTVASWVEPLETLKGFVEKSVGAYLAKATSTFKPFVKKLLCPEMSLAVAKSVLDPNIVGSVDCEADHKERDDIDFTKIFVAYVTYMQQATVEVQLPGESEGVMTPMKVHCTFLCVAGSLLQLSKYIAFFQQKVADDPALKPFDDLINQEFANLKGKEKPVFTYKMDWCNNARQTEGAPEPSRSS